MSSAQSHNRRLAVAVIISLAVHMPAVYLGFWALSRFDDEETEPTYFEVMPLLQTADPDELTEEQREEDEEYEPEEDLPNGQVVDAPEAGEQRRPESERFLSERDQVVEEQRRAVVRLTGSHRRSPSVSAPPTPQVNPTPQREQEQEQPEVEERPLMAGLILNDRGLPAEERGDHNARQAPPPVREPRVNLRPSIATLSDAVGGPGLDHLVDIEDGQNNLLSTARWRHAPFFQRVKHQVEQYWRPDIAFRRHDPGGHVYGYRDRETVVRVVLNPDGSLERTYVVRGCGADFLDVEAIRAIEQAAPFPNPPRGLVDPRTDTIVFAFGFTVILGERPIFRLRRY